MKKLLNISSQINIRQFLKLLALLFWMKKVSAGLLMYKFDKEKNLRVFIVHPGGPFWKGKEKGAWSIPKGEPNEGEEMLEAAKREFLEEIGVAPPPDNSKYAELGSVTQKSGKEVYGWAVEGDWTGLLICSSYIEIEWPYKSGKIMKIPEIDKAGFFSVEKAKELINPAQFELIERLVEKLK
jgi:predicted NUDIX family NTP pyrophosphohydrolase